MSCAAVLGVVTGKGDVAVVEVIDGVRGDVGDFNESAVRLRVNASNSSFSATEWRRGERRGGEEAAEVKLEVSLMSVAAMVEISVSASESVLDEETSLAEEVEEKGRNWVLAGK